MAGGDSPAVQIVLQFSTEESRPSVTVNIRRKTTKRLNSGERHLTTEEAEVSLEAKANGNRLYSSTTTKRNLLPLGDVAIGPLKSTLGLLSLGALDNKRISDQVY